VEHAVARGRNYLAKTLIEGKTDFDKQTKQSIFECLLCGACIENCAPQVPTHEIMTAARYSYIQNYGQSALQHYIFNKLLQDPQRMAQFMKLVSISKRSGVSNFAKILRILGWYGRNISTMEDIIEVMPKTFFRDLWAEQKPDKTSAEFKVGYFLGCGINYAFPEVGNATVKLLCKNHNVHVLDNYCCGLPASGYGDVEAAQQLAQKNLQLFKEANCDFYVTDCASCASFLKDYSHLFNPDSEWRELADSFSKKIYDITHFLTKHPINGKFKTDEKTTVTYHDPCHLSHYLKITAEPRQLIKRIEGVDFRELPEADWCCGGAGSYNISHYELSMKIVDRKMQNLLTSGARLLLTNCPGCLIQLSYGVRRYQLNVKVQHISQLLLETFQE